jgi:hypothetical protein
MAKQKFTSFTPRPKPKKRPGIHKKSKSKSEKLQQSRRRYKGQGRWKLIILNYQCLKLTLRNNWIKESSLAKTWNLKNFESRLK